MTSKPPIQITPFRVSYLDTFREALGLVAREKKFLAFLDAPPIEAIQQFATLQEQENMPHLIAVSEDDRVIGWCDISPLDRPVFAHVGTLGMGIIPEYRGLGIGEKLINTALDMAKKRGLTRIELTVREGNLPAQRLYQKVGFEVEGVHKNAVLIDGVYENHVFMALVY